MVTSYSFDIVGQRSRRLSSSTKEEAIFEKDVLRIGQWKTQSGIWNVTADVLTDIVQNFQRFLQLGNRVPVKLNHSDDVRDTVGTVTRLRIEGDTLIARLSIADEETIERIGKTFNEVSVEVREPFEDGQKNRFNVMLTHLAIVDIPVVNDQAPFRRMLSSMKTFMKNKVRRLQTDDDSADTGTVPDMGTVEFRIMAINALLKAAGSAIMIPDDTTEEDFDSVLKTLMQTVAMQTGSGHEDEQSLEGDTASDTAPTEELLSLQSQLDEQKKLTASLQAESDTEKLHAFSNAVDGHIRLGRITPARKDALMKQGKAAKYQLAMLAPYDDIPVGAVVPTKSVVKTIGAGDSSDNEMTEKEKDDEVDRFLGRA